jgi:hypothetical protein
MEILETLLNGVRSACAAFPDKRRGDVRYSMADIGLSAFSLFFMQSESFLAYQRELEAGRKTSNCHSLFGMAAIPTDNHIRSMLDPVPPRTCSPPLIRRWAFCVSRRPRALPAARWPRSDRARRHGILLFAKLGCPQCLTRRRANGKTESYHAMLAATLVAPGHAMALPLMPEFIAPKTAQKSRTANATPPGAGWPPTGIV